MLTSDPVGGPEAALKLPLAPSAPDPLAPVVSTPLNAITVIEAAALCESAALTETLLKADGVNARQISASPN